MSQPFVGQVVAVGFNFAPVGWALCNGQTLSISEYQVLFTLIGTTYGGNGTTTFNVPNLQGRGIVNTGQAPGLQNYTLGAPGGSESVTLTTAQIGTHTHTLNAAANATAAVPAANEVLGTPSKAIYATTGVTTPLAGNAIGNGSGGSLPHENRQPFVTVNYIIALFGLYPSQS